MNEIVELDAAETEALFGSPRWDTQPIHDALVKALAAGAGIFVTGLTPSHIETLRTRMERSQIRISTRRAIRGGNRGHVIVPKPWKEEA